MLCNEVGDFDNDKWISRKKSARGLKLNLGEVGVGCHSGPPACLMWLAVQCRSILML